MAANFFLHTLNVYDFDKDRLVDNVYGLIGAGGYGREVMPVVESMVHTDLTSKVDKLVFVIEGLSESIDINGHQAISLDEFIKLPNPKRFNIAIGDSKARERIAKICLQAGISPFSIRANNVVELNGNDVGPGAIMSPFVMLTSNVKIGSYFHANIYSYVAHDCVIGDYVTFAPSVKCNGNVRIGDHAYIGTGAILKQGSKEKPLVIGEGAVVGMGAVVTKDVAPYTTVVGNPAKPLLKSGI